MASKAKSGLRADYARQADKRERAAQHMLARYRDADQQSHDATARQRESRQLVRLQEDARQLRDWLAKHPKDRKGAGKDGVRLSNRTDNESAKMTTGKGVIQGYTGVASVDEKAQVIVDAQAHGTGTEHALLLPVVDATAPMRTLTTVITADAGYHSAANLQALAVRGIDAYIPDSAYRKRDERYADRHIHTSKPDPLWDKSPATQESRCFRPTEFTMAKDYSHCICPAGNAFTAVAPTARSMATPSSNSAVLRETAYHASGGGNAY